MSAATKHLNFRSILCPVDFSACSSAALDYARAVARRQRAALHVVYVNDPLLVVAAATAMHDDMVKRSARELRVFVNKSVRPTRRSRVSLQVRVGDPVTQILKVARSQGADLIVMGTHGLTGADRWLVGSTTLDVLRRTRVPVLIIPSRPRRRARLHRSWPGKRILAAIDVNGASTHDVTVAIRAAAAFGSTLVLAHAVKDRATPAWLKNNRLGPAGQLRHVWRRMVSLAAVARRKMATDIRVVKGSPGELLGALAKAENLQLIVTTLRARRRWFEPKRGSVSYQLILRARIPVLACPPRWRLP
ncbi:MAG TPA: universal stress protein [Vicinamibacterales bacterium]|jgi:universal stress protein A